MTIEEIKEAFLNKFPEYKNYLIKIDKNQRWGEKGGEILIFPKDPELPFYDDHEYWWWEIDDEGNLVFEEQKDYKNVQIKISIPSSLSKEIYYKIQERSFQITKNKETIDVIKKYKELYEKEIREELAEKILSGELELIFSEENSNYYPCPLSKIKNKLISI
jgi:hypothetical protein